VRYLLPIVAGALLLLPSEVTRRAYAAVAVSLLLALGVAIGDAGHAACYRDTANNLRGRHFYFAGHWGWQYYAEAAGGTLIDSLHPPLLRPGNAVILNPRTFGDPGDLRLAPGALATAVELPCASSWPLETTTCDGWGSWYGDQIGGCRHFPIDLPFAFSQEPFDHFRLFVVK
jgi:hypothetical protein